MCNLDNVEVIPRAFNGLKTITKHLYIVLNTPLYNTGGIQQIRMEAIGDITLIIFFCFFVLPTARLHSQVQGGLEYDESSRICSMCNGKHERCIA